MSSSSAKPDNTPALRTATDDPPTPKVQAEEADDDDYDDLDDVVSNFQSTGSTRPRTNTRVAPSATDPSTSLPNPNHAVDDEDEDMMNTDFAKELARGMEELMKEMGGGAESLFSQPPPASSNASGAGSFQDTIKETMERLRASESAGSGASSNAQGEPSLEALLSSLGGLGGGGEDDEEIAGFIDHMMNAIITKDILYEPLKEMSDKYPAYLASPPTPLGPKDLERYTNQSKCVAKIIAIFEEPGYSDEKEKEREGGGRIVDLMSEMQSYGTPPEELIGEPIPGLTGEGVPEGCIIA